MYDAPRLRILERNEDELILEKCYQVLTRKGVRVEYQPALDLLKNAGAAVDEKSQTVRFSFKQIEDALKSAPSSFTVKGSREDRDFALPHPEGSYYTSTCIQTMRYHDPDSGDFRDVTAESLAEWTMLAEKLPNIHKIAMQTPCDVPQSTADVHSLYIHLRHATKPLMVLAYCPETVDFLFELMLARAGSEEALAERPMLLTYPTAFSPLRFKPMDMETIFKSCRYGIPIVVNSLAISGATAPVTVAGTVLLAAAEILAMIVMTQLVKPGTPVVASVYTTSMDMATGNALLGNADGMLARAAAAQFIKRNFGVPVETFSFMTDSYLSDGQAMVEKSLMPALLDLSGSDIQYGSGRLGGASFASPVQLVIDDELYTVIGRCNSIPEITEETLAIREIMDLNLDEDFFTTDHTIRHCRDNIRPELFVAESYDTWKEKGANSLYERAVERYRELRKDLKPPDIPADRLKDMESVVKTADKQLNTG